MQEVQITSLLQEDFGSGKWDGGRATPEAAWYTYRKVIPKDKAVLPFLTVEARVVWVDSGNGKHEIPYRVGNAEHACIRQEPDSSSDEAEKGYGLSGRNGAQFKINPESELGMLLNSFYTANVPGSRIGNDIRGIIGIDSEVVAKPHEGVKDDKYPMLLVARVYDVPSSKKKKASDEEEMPKTKRKPAAKEEDEPEETKSSAGKMYDLGEGTPKRRAKRLILAVAKEGDGATTISEVIRKGNATLSKDDDRKAIIAALGDEEWVKEQDDWEVKRSGQIVLAE